MFIDNLRPLHYTRTVVSHPPHEIDFRLVPLAQQALARCDAAALFTEEPGRITRTFCSPAMADLHVALRGWMTAAGMQTRVDAAGNLFGRYESPLRPNAPALLIGSHLDSVPNAGRYDGVLGVMLGLALVEAVQQSGLQLPFALEVVGFSEEEGVRYGIPFIGSRALVGDCEGLLNRQDSQGISVADALRHFGCDPSNIGSAELAAERYCGYLEPHIEQGPVLEYEKSPLSVVTAIAGQTRAMVRFVGVAGHAGTVPMELRRDALAAAAVWIIGVESIGHQNPGLVATVGTIEVLPGASNVIPGEARLRLDIRHTDDAVRASALNYLDAELGFGLSEQRNVGFHFSIVHEHSAVAMDSRLSKLLEESIAAAGHRTLHLPSGAGHDAAVMARRWPAAMLFIRCTGGVSHHPDESVTLADVTSALTAMWHFVRRLAEQPLK